MIVNSVNFLIFFLVVFFVYYFPLKGHAKAQNIWLLLASYFFYGFAEWKMIPLLFAATVIFYGLGLAIGSNAGTKPKRSSYLTTLGVVLGLGLLLYFKYLNFFIQSFSSFFNAVGLKTHWSVFHILLPIGISFFTFKLISYVIEVHRKNMEPCRNFVDFATYIAFFPTILSGPIDRPKPFLAQLSKARGFDEDLATIGLKRILWGMFMKTCVADRLSIYGDAVFGHALHHNGVSLGFATLLYPIQMYADFAGYSEMAIGVGCLLGIKITENFKRPFFSQNIAEYWRKWHISLTGWLTDYVFMPLNVKFRDMEKWGSIFAIIITFILIGMWHGAAWTFALFGLYHGLLYIPLMLSGTFFKKKKVKKTESGLPPFNAVLKMIGTFLLVSFGLILFRSASLAEAGMVVKKIATEPGPLFFDYQTLINGLLCMLILFFKDFWDEYRSEKQLFSKGIINRYRYELTLAGYALLILFFGVLDGNQFIYFKF
ncbi:D-alanyl-lipoteichoic acid acyltransferase DltB (MBOAT superfamily) [Mucilaginibacter yixingensis]|uniref:D-alanyl-lipoteichoic acid acyltransferase DltB (MBOAT superfamily) n=1 Tax=Mucilaginibacter yixingensis TaxID=1295612 RepID=A0A2T5J947_9SPHI|nr:MBOAT family O-acyltransferase [Mucilaginibacter yixingensis]PTQ96603.1 D-alanyl-lipoteichoic acid acyltransferase DltB (MBOAT superfamily) [Mucilaginibacter yixingensis]